MLLMVSVDFGVLLLIFCDDGVLYVYCGLLVVVIVFGWLFLIVVVLLFGLDCLWLCWFVANSVAYIYMVCHLIYMILCLFFDGWLLSLLDFLLVGSCGVFVICFDFCLLFLFWLIVLLLLLVFCVCCLV